MSVSAFGSRDHYVLRVLIDLYSLYAFYCFVSPVLSVLSPHATVNPEKIHHSFPCHPARTFKKEEAPLERSETGKYHNQLSCRLVLSSILCISHHNAVRETCPCYPRNLGNGTDNSQPFECKLALSRRALVIENVGNDVCYNRFRISMKAERLLNNIP